MTKFVSAVGVSLLLIALGARTRAQAPAAPLWAYGLPPVGERTAPSPPLPPDPAPRTIPGTTKTMSMAEIRDYWNVGDWFPEEHPPMPSVVVHGRQPRVRGCAMCHMPGGKGRPENAPLAGLNAGYFVQQLLDFKHGLRTSADARKTNTGLMIEAAKT